MRVIPSPRAGCVALFPVPESARPSLTTTPRPPPRIARYAPIPIPTPVSRDDVQVLKYDEIPPDLWSLGALVFSFLGVTMKYRGCAWFGALFAVAAWANKRTHDADTKQIFTGAVFAIAGLSVNAINSYHGMQARAREAGASAPGAERDDGF